MCWSVYRSNIAQISLVGAPGDLLYALRLIASDRPFDQAAKLLLGENK